MSFNDLMTQLPTATKPLSNLVYKSSTSKLIAIGLNEQVRLEKHTAPGRTKLIVIEGHIQYKCNQKTLDLHAYDSYDIPLNEVHSVEALSPSLFLLLIA